MTKISAYLAAVDTERQAAFRELYQTVKDRIPAGFEEHLQYGMISFVVPLKDYPTGYLDRPEEPLPFISLAAQKRHIALYHMGLMGDPELLAWFQQAYQEVMPTKLNMGKSCIRFTNAGKIPYELLGELVSKTTMAEWITAYEKYHNATKK